MHRILSCCLLLSLVLLPATSVYGQGRKGKKNSVTTLETTAQDYLALSKMKGVAARVLSLQPTGDNVKVVIRAEYQVPQATGKPGGAKQNNRPKQGFRPKQNNNRKPKIRRPNNRPPNNRRPGNRGNNGGRGGNRGGTNPQQLAREYQQIMRIQNPAQRQQRLRQFMSKMQNAQRQALQQQLQLMQRQQQEARKFQQQMLKRQQQLAKQNRQKYPQGKGAPGGVKMVTYAKEFTLVVSNKARIARKTLGIEYDDKGNIVQYTPEQLAKMKDDKLPGYKSRLEDVEPGMVAYFYLAPPNANGKKKVGIGDLVGGAEEGGDNMAMNGPTVTGLLILTEADPDSLPTQKGKRKKKKK